MGPRPLPGRRPDAVQDPRRSDAELVALGVLHHHPVDAQVRVLVEAAGPERLEPGDLGRDPLSLLLSGTDGPPPERRSMCTRFLTVLASGTRWKKIRG